MTDSTRLKVIEYKGEKITLLRRTNASKAAYRVISAKLLRVFNRLAAELHLEPETIDAAMVDFGLISSQIQDASARFARAGDSEDELLNKARYWLLEMDPDLTDMLTAALVELNYSWHDRATAPQPLPEDADPN